jgi:hypothetical protein
MTAESWWRNYIRPGTAEAANEPTKQMSRHKDKEKRPEGFPGARF